MCKNEPGNDSHCFVLQAGSISLQKKQEMSVADNIPQRAWRSPWQFPMPPSLCMHVANVDRFGGKPTEEHLDA